MKPVRIVPDSKYPNMWRLQWADGVTSADFYNFTRANDILRRWEGYADRQRKSLVAIKNNAARVVA